MAALVLLLLALPACTPGPMVAGPGGPPQPPGPGAPPPGGPPPLPGGPVKVAVLLPLAGANADLGKSMLEAAQMALFTTGNDRLTLVPRDTGGTPDGAAGAARAALADGAQLIIGPLLAAEVDAVKPVAAVARVNVIAFSTATQLAGDNVFLMGFLPRQEVAREVSFARERGLTRFAALTPKTEYGRLMADALRDTVGQAGGTVVKAETFDPRSADAGPAIQRLAGGAAAEGAPVGSSFDALLLPEGGEQLKQIARRLKQAGIAEPQVRLLGSGLWDDPTVSSEPALIGGRFAASPPEQRREFESRFQATYGHPPPRLASLAFDAAALAAVLAKTGGPAPFSHDAILNPSGFSGVDGLFRFTPNGLVQRGLAVLEVQPQGPVVVSPAPRDFRDFVY
ncbi:MAG: penicillin-binding protein activator [Alphaproteobacteria bacterium]|nr:penicillin-binding protein activator [Alphaproteobacteria bacterium]